MRWTILLLLLPVTMTCQAALKTMNWRYMVGTNADRIWNSKTNFYREGKPIHGAESGVVTVVS